MAFLQKLSLNLKTYFILFAVFLIYLSRRFPIQIPITDDWLYLELGSHQSSIFNNSLFELVGGHQQVLTKITVWLVGFMPGNYIQNLVIFNVFFALSGFYFLLVSQLKARANSSTSLLAIIAVIMVFNLKPLYLYFTATGLGLCQCVFLFGIYFHARSIEESQKSNWLIMLALFLAPFSTGMGLALPIAHSLHIIYKLLRNTNNFGRQDVRITIIICISIFISYVIPTYLGNINVRTPLSNVNSFSNLLVIFENPLNFFAFLITLVGNPLVPSSRFDPLLPFALGVIVLMIFTFLVIQGIGFSKLFHTIMSNKNPFLTGFVFISMITTFRGSNQFMSVNSAAPRFVFGSIFLLLGMFVMVAESYSFALKRQDKVLPLLFIVIMSFSLTGIKTGAEWLGVRSSQSKEIYACILAPEFNVNQCMSAADVIREADSKDKDLENDVNLLRIYFEKQNIIS